MPDSNRDLSHSVGKSFLSSLSRWSDVVHLPGSCWWPITVIVLALAFSLSTGPFRSPDEPNHFFRAYEVSQGHFVAQRVGEDLLGDYLPSSLVKVARIVAGFPNIPPLRTSKAAMSAAGQVKLKASHRMFVHFPGAAMHSPLVYVPAALGIAVGRLLRGGPLLLLYLGRCSNAIIAGGLIGSALRPIWLRGPFLATIALLPMCLSQVGMLTADALTLGISFFWYSEVLRARHGHKPASRWSWIFMAVALSQLRFPYPLLGLLVFSFPPDVLGATRSLRWRFLLFFFAALVLPCLGWIAIIRGLQVQMRPLVHVDPSVQLQFVLNHPLQFLHLIGASLAQFGFTYWYQMVGVLGWLDFRVPAWVLGGMTLSLFVTICCSDCEWLRPTLTTRLFSFALGTLGLLLTVLIVYLAWNSVGAPQLEGWQGRYALPLLPLMVFAFVNGWMRRARWLLATTVAFSIFANVATIVCLARATYF
jgi:uncharacterized membrane protein